MVTAKEAWALFATVTPKFIHIEDSHMQTIATALLTPGDVILFFSYSGSTRDMQEVLDLAKERHIPIVLITHFVNHWLPVMQTFLLSAAIMKILCSPAP